MSVAGCSEYMYLSLFLLKFHILNSVQTLYVDMTTVPSNSQSKLDEGQDGEGDQQKERCRQACMHTGPGRQTDRQMAGLNV